MTLLQYLSETTFYCTKTYTFVISCDYKNNQEVAFFLFFLKYGKLEWNYHTFECIS